MSDSLPKLLPLIQSPAFIASAEGEIEYCNLEMRQLIGKLADKEGIDLITLGLFKNAAEFRGFMRGFHTVGDLQRIKLPSTLLHQPSRNVVLQAIYFQGEGKMLGMISITDPKTSSELDGLPSAEEVLDCLPQLVIQTDGSGNVKYLNETASRMLKASDEFAEGLQVSIGDIDAEHSLRLWQERLSLANKGGNCEYETHLIRRGGTLLPVQISICHTKGFPVSGATLIATEITQQRTIEQKLRALELELEDLRFRREREKEYLSSHLGEGSNGKKIISVDSNYRRVLEQVKRVARTDSTVLITGETGTGKELVARAVHASSLRAKEHLMIVNCGALPRELIESELFGYRKGAFTGAVKNQAGRFELADQGTLFLDEIGEMPLDLQTRLLRFLQEGEFTPVGGTEPIYVDVRIIAATNRDLEKMVRQGSFRQDLFFRLNVFPINNPPLRERRQDIPVLVEHFIKKHSRRLNAGVERCAPEAMQDLMRYDFPGNIRELENIVERALITSEGKLLTLDWELPSSNNSSNTNDSPSEDHFRERELVQDLPYSFEEMQVKYIEAALSKSDGKVSGAGGAAELLGLKAQTLFSKMRKLGIR